MLLRSLAISLLLLFSGVLSADEIRAAYFRISDVSEVGTQSQRYDFLLRLPAGVAGPLLISPLLPDSCQRIGEVREWQQGRVKASQWRADCVGGLNGKSIEMAGLEAATIDVLVRYERADETTQLIRLTPTETTFALSESESGWQVAATYFLLGAEHILMGIDHLLFVLALLMIVSSWRKLVATVTAFTIAHSITLGASTLKLVSLPQAPVEAVIALSIVFVCMEIVHWREGRPGLTRSYPWIVAFIFGLLHGFGFAGALSEIGLPENAIPIALLFFNVGVEAGQLLFVASVLGAWQLLKRIAWPEWAWRIPVYGIGSMAGFWTIERISSFL